MAAPAAENVPRGHVVHEPTIVVPLAKVRKEPAGQLVHVAAPAAEN